MIGTGRVDALRDALQVSGYLVKQVDEHVWEVSDGAGLMRAFSTQEPMDSSYEMTEVIDDLRAAGFVFELDESVYDPVSFAVHQVVDG